MGSHCFLKHSHPSNLIDHSTRSNSSSIEPTLFFNNNYFIVHSNNSNQSSYTDSTNKRVSLLTWSQYLVPIYLQSFKRLLSK